MDGSKFKKSEAAHPLVYGDSKTGKSTLVIELLKKGYSLDYFSIDGGIPLDGLTDDDLSRLKVFPLRDTADFPVAISTCRKVMKGHKFNLCDIHGQIDCGPCRAAGMDFSEVHLGNNSLDHIAVFDHLTSLANSALNTCWDGEAFADSGSVKDDGGGYTIWRQQGWLLTDFLTKVQVAPFNVICIAQETMVIFDDKSKKVGPNCGTDRFSATVPSFFTDVVHCSISNGAHRFGSSSTYKQGVMTGSRSKIVLETMAKPSLAPFFVPAAEGKDIKLNVVKAQVENKAAVSSNVSVPNSIEAMKALMGKKGVK